MLILAVTGTGVDTPEASPQIKLAGKLVQ